MESVLNREAKPSKHALAVFDRIRRMGWILAGHTHLSDQILLGALEHDPAAATGGPSDDPFENLFAWAFQSLDASCRDDGPIRLLTPSTARAELINRLHGLPYELRVATLLLIVEELSLERGAQISGRPAFSLASAAAVATQRLDSFC